MARLRRSYERMDEAIRDSGGPWLLGLEITLADVAVMPALVRMADLKREGDWADLPRVAKWYELIRAQAAFCQDERHLRVLQQERDAIRRIVRVERYVGAAGLEHRQQADDQVRRAMHEHADECFRSDPACAQGRRPSIRAGMQVAIRECAFAIDQRHRIGRRERALTYRDLHARDT